jgi:cation diffusion facilitator CzcD-associated flavoprotein CzcO
MAGGHLRIAIVGGGFAGIGCAIRLKQEGIHDFVVFERADDVGGTWRDNSYPGCACDVPSLLYSYSFAPEPEWPHAFSRQPEIWDYLRRCVRRFGITPHLRLGAEVNYAAWNREQRRWDLDTTAGSWTADVLVSAAGPLSEPAVPGLAGLEAFTGTAFHSARWRHDHDLSGRRVAVVGTGASAVQFIPEIQPLVTRLSVFQRTPPWVLPRRDRRISSVERALYRRAPTTQKAARAGIYWGRELLVVGLRHPRLQGWQQALARHHLARNVPDPGLRAALTPDYVLGCKRILLSSSYLPALTKGNVEVVTDEIARVEPDAILTRNGSRHPVDTIIFGTGFHVTDPPVADRIRGRDGRTLAETWAGSPAAYLGTTVAGFPNLFLLLGPNTGLGHNSVLFMLEAQLEHVLAVLGHLQGCGVAAVEPAAERQRAYLAEVDRKMAGTVWSAGGCRSWYQDPTGRVAALWPSYTWPFRRRLRRLEPADYVPV